MNPCGGADNRIYQPELIIYSFDWAFRLSFVILLFWAFHSIGHFASNHLWYFHWLVVEPTHLKNMRKPNWIISPQIGVKIKNLWNQLVHCAPNDLSFKYSKWYKLRNRQNSSGSCNNPMIPYNLQLCQLSPQVLENLKNKKWNNKNNSKGSKLHVTFPATPLIFLKQFDASDIWVYKKIGAWWVGPTVYHQFSIISAIAGLLPSTKNMLADVNYRLVHYFSPKHCTLCICFVDVKVHQPACFSHSTAYFDTLGQILASVVSG